MKNLKILLVTLITVFAFNISSAQVRVKIYPKRGAVVTKIHKPKVVVHKKVNYYHTDGVWYNRMRIKGRKYYKYRGVVYKKQRRNYVVVTV